MRHGELCDDERASKVDIDRVVPLLEADVENAAHTLTIACVDDQNVRMLAMLLFDFVEETLEIFFFADIALVR